MASRSVEARTTTLEQLLRRVEDEHAVVRVLRDGRPIAELRPLSPATSNWHLPPFDETLKPMISRSDAIAPLDEEDWPSEVRPMLLLDTCTMIWLAQDRSQLSPHVAALLEVGGPQPPIVSAISGFEIAIKWQKGKLKIPLPPREWFEQTIQRYGLRIEPVLAQDAIESVLLPLHHNDPMDRIIIATAARLALAVATPDPQFPKYTHIKSIW